MNDADLLSDYEKRRRASLDAWADQQEATPPEKKSAYLSPIGPQAPEGYSPPGAVSKGASAVGGAVNTGLLRGGAMATEGLKSIKDGLLGLVSPTAKAPFTNTGMGQLTGRVEAVQKIVSGLFGTVLAAPMAATGIVGAGIDAAAPDALDAPLLDPHLSGFLRIPLLATTGDYKTDHAPMTGREILDIVGGLLFLSRMNRKPGAKGEAPAAGGPEAGQGGPQALPAGPAGPLALGPAAMPRPMPGNVPKALPPARMGERPAGGKAIDLGPGEAFEIIETLQREGKWEPLVQAFESSEVKRAEMTPQGMQDVIPGTPQRQMPSTGIKPKGQQAAAGGLFEKPGPEQADLLTRTYGQDLARTGDAVERAVAKEIGALPIEDVSFAEFSKFIDEGAARADIRGGGAMSPADVYGEMYGNLRDAAAGSRSRHTQTVQGKGKVETFVATPSTYPEYLGEIGVPRTRKGADRAMKALDEVLASEEPAVSRFQTSQGSTYEIGEGGVTTRTKSAHQGHDPADVGKKATSQRTVYVTPEQATDIGAHLTLNKEAKPYVAIEGDKIVLSSKYGRDEAGNTYAKTRRVEISFTAEPKVGVSPVEFWERGKVHAGNAITEVSSAELSPTAQKIIKYAERRATEQNYLDEARADAAKLERGTRQTDLGLLGEPGERGAVSLDTVTALSRMAIGALVGGSTGDTPEERIRNAFLGAGVGALLSGKLARAVIQNVSKPNVLATLRDESGVIRIPNFRTIETSEKVKTFMREMSTDEVFQKETERQARGVRTHDETAKAALRLIKDGKFRARDVLNFETGTVLNPEQANAARMLTQAAANRVVNVAEAVKAGRASLDDLNAAMALSARMTVNTHAVMTEAGRTLNALGMTVSGDVPLRISPERMAEEAAKWPRDARLPDLVIDLAEIKPEEVGRFARLRAALPDAVLEIYYGVSLLSNPMTQFRNIAGNSMALASSIGERQLSGVLALNPFRDPSKPHVALGEAGQGAIAISETFMDALRTAGRAAREGINVTKLDYPMREPAFTAERLGVDPATPWGAGLDYLGKYARFNLKAMEAEDTFFRLINFNFERKALAIRQAEFEGLAGDVKATRVAELWREPPDWLMQEAWSFAKEQTFSKEFEGRMKSAQNALGHPLTKLTVLPFFRTPMRLAEYAAERTPVLNTVTSQFWADMQAGGARREIALGKLGTGAAIASTIGYLTLQGFVTGNPPKDAEERKRMEDDGVRWTSIYNPATKSYHSYGNLEPISSIVAVVADTMNMLKRAPDVDSLTTEAAQVVTAVVVSAVRNLASKQYLQSIGHFLDSVQNPDTAGALKGLNRQLASWMPAIVAQAERIIDPAIRETETLLDEFQAKTPWASESLAPRRSIITGKPVAGAPTFYRATSGDPVLHEIARLQGAGIRAPLPSINGKPPSSAPIPMETQRGDVGLPLNKKQYDELIVYMATHEVGGKTLHQALAAEIASDYYKKQTEGQDGGKALRLRQWVDAYKGAAKEWMAGQMGPQLTEQAAKKMRRLTPSTTNDLTGTLRR